MAVPLFSKELVPSSAFSITILMAIVIKCTDGAKHAVQHV